MQSWCFGVTIIATAYNADDIATLARVSGVFTGEIWGTSLRSHYILDSKHGNERIGFTATVVCFPAVKRFGQKQCFDVNENTRFLPGRTRSQVLLWNMKIADFVEIVCSKFR